MFSLSQLCSRVRSYSEATSLRTRRLGTKDSDSDIDSVSSEEEGFGGSSMNLKAREEVADADGAVGEEDAIEDAFVSIRTSPRVSKLLLKLSLTRSQQSCPN